MGWLGRFIWPFCRCGGLVLTAPIIGSRYVPTRIRVVVGATLALVLASALPGLPPLPNNPWQVMAMAGSNLFYGAALGFVMWIAVTAITVSGEMMGLSMALGFARLSSPTNGTSIPVLSEIMQWAGLMAYLAAGGPQWLIGALYHSFLNNPSAALPSGTWLGIATAGKTMFSDGLWLALPVVVAGLAVNAVLGVITGLAPALNVFSIGFPMLYLMGMWILVSSSSQIQHVFSNAYSQAMILVAHLAS